MKLFAILSSTLLSGAVIAGPTKEPTGTIIVAAATTASPAATTPPPPPPRQEIISVNGTATYHPIGGVSVPIEWSILYNFKLGGVRGETIVSMYSDGVHAQLDHFRTTATGCYHYAIACGIRDKSANGYMFTYEGNLAGAGSTCAAGAAAEDFSDVTKYDGNIIPYWTSIISAMPRMYCQAAVTEREYFDIRIIVRAVEKQVEAADGWMNRWLYH